METRKKRATELVEKCDMKVFANTEKTQIVQIYDRRVKVELSDSLLDNTSLYSVARSWIQDDPEKQQPEIIKIRGVRPITASAEGRDQINSKKRKESSTDDCLSADSKPEDFKKQLEAHVRNFKQIRRRSVVLSAARYAKSVSALDEMKIPRLLTMMKILSEEGKTDLSENLREVQNP